MKRKLPKKIKVGHTNYAVVRKYKRLRDIGEIDYKGRVVSVATRDKFGNRLSVSEQFEVFWHEVVHGILHDMEHPLRDNERFVVAFSRRLNGALESAEFE